MKKRYKDQFWPWTLGAAAVLIGIGGAVFLWQRAPSGPAEETAPPVAAPAASSVDARAPAAPPATTPAPRPAIPLPPLAESDADILGGLNELVGAGAVEEFAVPERIVRNVVVTVDNAAREKMALNQRPIKPTPEQFIVSGPEGARVIDAANYDRYAPFVALVGKVDAKTLVSLYRGFQPLFQQAYEELGHPNDVFDSRLVEVIEHLLSTPEVTGEIRLVQPSVLYLYADPELERLSAGQKVLVRMGPENARKVKAKLREILNELR